MSAMKVVLIDVTGPNSRPARSKTGILVVPNFFTCWMVVGNIFFPEVTKNTWEPTD